MPKNFPKIRKTLGDHILTKYLRLGLSHREAAKQLGVDRHVLWGWTANRKEVHLKFIPNVIAWLGYNPLPNPKSLGGRLRRKRVSAGMSQEELGRVLRIRSATILDFEKGRRPNPDHGKRIYDFLESNSA